MAGKKRTPTAHILIAIIVILALITAGTIAWFINYKASKLSGYSVTVGSGNVMQISLDGENYANSQTIDFDEGEYEGFEMLDITGDGASFYRPALLQNESGAFVDESGSWRAAVPGKDYISFKLYLRANSQMKVYLNGDSKVTPESNTSTINQSNYGQFTRDCIAGASRISILDKAGAVKLVWAPNPMFQLIHPDNGEWKFNYTGTPETEYKYYTYDTESSSFVQNVFDGGVFITKSNVTMAQVPTDADPMLTVLETDPLHADDGYYYSELLVNIWVEGTDREAKRALSGGVFQAELQLAAFDMSVGEGETAAVTTAEG